MATVTPDCPGPNPPTRPKLTPPPGSCDTHFHVIGPYDRYRLVEQRSYTAPEAPFAKAREELDTLGIDRGVIVHVSGHGTDMSVSADAIAAFDGRCRGVAVLPDDIGRAGIERLHAQGFRGARLSGIAGRRVEPERVRRVAEQIAPLGWHLVYFTMGPDWPVIAPILPTLPCEVVIDHMAYRAWASDPRLDNPGFALLREIAGSGRIWVKISGAFRYATGAPPWSSAYPFAEALIADAPGRILWGSDWPHVNMVDRPMPDTADVFDWLAGLRIDRATLQRILVDNPAALYGFDA